MHRRAALVSAAMSCAIVVIAVVAFDLAMKSAANMTVASRVSTHRTKHTLSYGEFRAAHPVRDPACKPLVIFFHVCNIGEWSRVASAQMDDIVRSGLYDAVQHVFYGCSCPGCDAEISGKLMHRYAKAVQLPSAPSTDVHENHTINQVLRYARRNPDSHVLYIHSKGVTAVSPNQEYWREFMMNYNVHLWRVCVDLLRRGCDTVGVNKKKGVPYYSGNFWWARCGYLATLTDVRDMTDRLSAETKLLERAVQGRHVNLGDELWWSPAHLRWGMYSPHAWLGLSRRRDEHAAHRRQPDSIPVVVF